MKISLSGIAIFCMICSTTFNSCSKYAADEPVNTAPALVKATKVPCGQGCSAEAWLLSINESTVYEPVNLPAQFKIHNYPVEIMIREQPGMGITGNPAVELVRIIPRH